MLLPSLFILYFSSADLGQYLHSDMERAEKSGRDVAEIPKSAEIHFFEIY